MTKNVLLLGCAFPQELPYFARGVAAVGARVFGVDQVPESHLPPMARESLSGYCQVPSLFDEETALETVRRWAGSVQFDRVETLWEPCVLLAARLREALAAPGIRYEQAVCFRDKDRMKQAVADAGLRTPRHKRASGRDECLEAAEQVGFPVCLKPIAGAGSENTFRVESAGEMESILARLPHVRDFNVEEFIDGDEYTYDTICIDGRVVFENLSWYRPRPLIGRSVEWISPQTVTLRDVDAAHLDAGRVLGRNVLEVLGQESGFAHMEWYRKSDGEAVFGEIAARPPGAHTVDTMNFACDLDLFTGWAEAVVNGTWSPSVERLYNCAIVYKRAQGQGHIRRIEGLDRILGAFGEHIPAIELLPVGAHRRDWVKTLLSDGFVFVRHPDLDRTCEMADRIGTDLQLYAE
jgi:formate-dependent phosphoribosylglycinamide formyltransferase (GAR transformylase)